MGSLKFKLLMFNGTRGLQFLEKENKSLVGSTQAAVGIVGSKYIRKLSH